MTTTVHSTKISEVKNKIPDHARYITTSEFDKLTTEKFTTRLQPGNLVNKTDFDNKLINFNINIYKIFRSSKKAK